MLQDSRVQKLNDKKIVKGIYVLYWMQASVRNEYNHALEYSIQQANELKQPLIVMFVITDNYPEAKPRHYQFLIEGLCETHEKLAKRNINLIIRQGLPVSEVLRLCEEATILIVDRGYTKTLRRWRKLIAAQSACPVIQVESNIIVPVEITSNKEEYSAATIRSKLNNVLDQYLVPLKKNVVQNPSLNYFSHSSDLDQIRDKLCKHREELKCVIRYTGGTSKAMKLLEDFTQYKLNRYHKLKNDPTKDICSNMSPYLHFGQISPLQIVLQVNATKSPYKHTYLDELIIRRELAINFVTYNPFYDSIQGLPNWCRKTLDEHKDDPREYVYDLNEFEKGNTHDPYWNAAQQEMVITGKMHGYMRMYWGKKILEWCETPEEAYRIALYFNNKYELDGRGPNSYAGVAWCFGKHDRPWKERPIFGKIRYMNARGLKRKFNIDQYVNKITALSERYSTLYAD